MKNQVKKKPTNKEMANAIIEINNRVNECYSILRDLDSIIGLYIAMKNDVEPFNKYVKKVMTARKKEQEKKNESSGNEKPDTGNIPPNPKDAGSGTEGVRAEGK